MQTALQLAALRRYLAAIDEAIPVLERLLQARQALNATIDQPEPQPPADPPLAAA